MTIDAKCSVCKNADRRRLIELGWNGGMGAATIAALFDGINGAAVLKHLKEHSDGDGNMRAIDVEPVLPARERVLNLQKLQLDEVERRIGLAKTRAAMMNAERAKITDDEGNPIPELDWSDFYDILGKDAQAAISSILKTQGLSDKRDKAQGDLRLGLFEAMSNAGLSPKALIGGKDAPLQLAPIEDAEDD